MLKVLLSDIQIKDAVKRLAAEVMENHPDGVLLVGVLKGAFVFLADLLREFPADYNVSVDFVQVSSYSGTESTGLVKFLKDIDQPIEGRDVILVEDIVDTGLTLQRLYEIFLARHPKTLEVMVLLDKKERRQVDVPIHYTGFVIPDEFVIGYGLDYNERFRNLPYVGVYEGE
ncbi:hypoxanthine phosphoribosyltransferase [bacterium 3DAC]|jgi:hypoxanthine phosphoribosyltransferase|nr:hypoxanthine phosphoribosyltransferase [Dictyoglomota bacterium]UZN22927.1 hypoxanthine phosphoribosyltransferase [bacterium 3DAC]